MTQRIVAIMAHQRSGTHLLGSAAASHPEIKYTGEIFRRQVPRARRDVLAVIKRVRGGGFPVILIDTKYNQISGAVEGFLGRPDVGVIHLVRENLLRLYFSGELHSWRAQYGADDQIPRFRFDRHRFDKLCRTITAHRRRFDYLTDLKLYYEELTGDRDIAELPEWAGRQICQLVGVDYQPLGARIRKEAPEDIFCHLEGVPDQIRRQYERQ